MKILVIEFNLKRLGGGSRCALCIADILKSQGHEVRVHNVLHLESLFEDINQIPEYFPIKHLTKDDYYETKEEVPADYVEFVKQTYPLSSALTDNLQWCDLAINSIEAFHNTISTLHPTKLCIYLHVYPTNAMDPMIRKAKMVLANSEHTQQEAIFWVPTANIPLLYPPIDPRDFDYTKPLKDRSVDFLFYGRIAPDKYGSFDFELVDWHIQAKNLKALAIGSGWAPYFDIKSSIERKRNLKFKEIASILGDSKIYIHTKKQEDYGQVIAEALAAGCVVFIPDTGWGPYEFRNVIHYQSEADLLMKTSRVLRALEKYEFEMSHRIQEVYDKYDQSVEKLKELFPL